MCWEMEDIVNKTGYEIIANSSPKLVAIAAIFENGHEQVKDYFQPLGDPQILKGGHSYVP